MRIRARGTMFLAKLGSGRSRRTRLVAGVAAAAMLFGPLQLAWATAPSAPSTGSLPDDKPRRSSERIRPVLLADLAGKIGADALWRLFDGDARTGLAAAGPVKIRLGFAEPILVDAVGAYGSAAG